MCSLPKHIMQSKIMCKFQVNDDYLQINIIRYAMETSLTTAGESIPCESTVARAGVTPFNVVTSCICMTPISVSSAFIYICSSHIQ